MELNVGMYVRTKDGCIEKICAIENEHIYTDEDYLAWYASSNAFSKARYNPIELIEEHDVLLLFDKEYGKNYKAEVVLDDSNFKVIVNYEQGDLLNLEYELITEEHVKLLSIVTKEQFEQIQYRIGESNA